MKETEYRNHGSALIKLLIIGCVIGIIATWVVPALFNEAHGMETQKLMAADEDTVKSVIKTLKRDRYLTVVILAYAPTWTMDAVDPVVDQARKVLNTFHDAGIYANRITMLFANKGGLAEDALPIPVAEGVYLYID